jgi:hypothetical protein
VTQNQASHADTAEAQPDDELARLNRKTASHEELVDYLEGLSGRVFYTRKDLADYIAALREGGERKKSDRKIGKQTGWLILLVVVFLQYAFVDIVLEVNKLRTASVVTPSARTTGHRM